MKPWAYPNQLLWISLPHFPLPNLQAFSLWRCTCRCGSEASSIPIPTPSSHLCCSKSSLVTLASSLHYSFLPYSLPVCRARSSLVYGRRVFSRDAEQIQIPTAGLLGVGWGVMSFPSPCLSLEPSAAQLSATFNAAEVSA